MECEITDGACGYWLEDTGKTCERNGLRLEPRRTKDGSPLGALGRRVGACRCEAHGGPAEAERELATSWAYLAPSSVRDVPDAGSRQLDTRAQVVVIRDAGEESTPPLFRVCATTREQRAALPDALVRALRDQRLSAPYTTTVRAQAEAFAVRAQRLLGWLPPIVEVPAAKRARNRWAVALGVGGCTQWVGAYETRELAMRFGMARWREHVRHAVRDIRRARGGTLEWGVRVNAPDVPCFVWPQKGESAWDAWERTLGASDTVLKGGDHGIDRVQTSQV